jgi:hypothetical protein
MINRRRYKNREEEERGKRRGIRSKRNEERQGKTIQKRKRKWKGWQEL